MGIGVQCSVPLYAVTSDAMLPAPDDLPDLQVCPDDSDPTNISLMVNCEGKSLHLVVDPQDIKKAIMICEAAVEGDTDEAEDTDE